MRPRSITSSPITYLMAMLLTPSILAMEVRVVNPEGLPVLDALVVCDGKAKGAALTNENGIATVADRCRRIQCLRGELLTGQAKVVEEGKALCRIGGGAVVTGEISSKLCRGRPDVGPDAEDGFYVALLVPHTLKAAGSSKIRLAPDGSTCGFQLKAVPPASYTLLVSLVSDTTERWHCATDLGQLTEGPHDVSAFWHDPSPLDVRVIGRDGKPASDLPIRITHVNEHEGELVPKGGHCLPVPQMAFDTRSMRPTMEETVTDEKGEAHCLFDPADATMILKVGDPEDPDWFVSIPTNTQRRGKLIIDLREKGDPH